MYVRKQTASVHVYCVSRSTLGGGGGGTLSNTLQVDVVTRVAVLTGRHDLASVRLLPQSAFLVVGQVANEFTLYLIIRVFLPLHSLH